MWVSMRNGRRRQKGVYMCRRMEKEAWEKKSAIRVSNEVCKNIKCDQH